MKTTVIIFLIIVLMISIFNMIRLGTARSNAPYVPVCDRRSISLVDNSPSNLQHDEGVNEYPQPNDTLVYGSKSVEPISSVI